MIKEERSLKMNNIFSTRVIVLTVLCLFMVGLTSCTGKTNVDPESIVIGPQVTVGGQAVDSLDKNTPDLTNSLGRLSAHVSQHEIIDIDILNASFTRDISLIAADELNGNGALDSIDFVPDGEIMLVLTMQLNLRGKEVQTIPLSHLAYGFDPDEHGLDSLGRLRFFSGHPTERLLNGMNYYQYIMTPDVPAIETIAFFMPLSELERVTNSEMYLFYLSPVSHTDGEESEVAKLLLKIPNLESFK